MSDNSLTEKNENTIWNKDTIFFLKCLLILCAFGVLLITLKIIHDNEDDLDALTVEVGALKKQVVFQEKFLVEVEKNQVGLADLRVELAELKGKFTQYAATPQAAPQAAPQVAPQVAQQAAPQQIIKSPQAATGGDSIFRVEDTTRAAAIIDILKTKNFGIASGGDGENKVYVFFDPRCPYCHEAWKTVKSIPSVWMPIVALGNPTDGEMKTRAILNNGTGDFLTNVFENKTSPDMLEIYKKAGGDAVNSKELNDKMTANLETFLAITSSINGRGGVPLFIIPAKDGTLYLHVGFNNGDAEVFKKYLGI